MGTKWKIPTQYFEFRLPSKIGALDLDMHAYRT